MDKTLKELINNHENITIFSGAGVSTLSGIKDFRGDNGLNKEKTFGLSIENILSQHFFNQYRHLFYRYYLEHIVPITDKEPNQIHETTKYLQDIGKLNGVVTQNIDGLYQKAGIKDEKLVEIHGNASKWICTKCKQEIDFSKSRYVEKTGNYLSACHDFIVKPGILLYEESFKKEDVEKMNTLFETSDLLIVMGTELTIIAHTLAIKRFKGTKAFISLNDPAERDSFRFLFGQQDVLNWQYKHIGKIEDVFNTNNVTKGTR